MNVKIVCDLPSVLMCSDVRTRANRVALNMTVPSLFKGMFMDTSLCKTTQQNTHTHAHGQSYNRRISNKTNRLFSVTKSTYVVTIYLVSIYLPMPAPVTHCTLTSSRYRLASSESRQLCVNTELSLEEFPFSTSLGAHRIKRKWPISYLP